MTRVSMPPLGAAAPARTSLAWDAGSDAYVFQSEAARYRVVVGPGDDTIEPTVIAAAAATGSGLVRMIRGSASLEDLFLNREAAL